MESQLSPRWSLLAVVGIIGLVLFALYISVSKERAENSDFTQRPTCQPSQSSCFGWRGEDESKGLIPFISASEERVDATRRINSVLPSAEVGDETNSLAPVILPVSGSELQQDPIEDVPIEPIRNSTYLKKTTVATTTTAQGFPIRIKIPQIGVDGFLESVGLTSEGAMDAPKNPANGAWFNLGPRPGEIGNAVLAGHFGWKDNRPAVFDNLHKLQKGDKLYVEDANGVTVVFVVRESRRYDPQADTTDVFISSDGTEHLILITCEGVWNKAEKSYSKRLVVFADME